MEWLISLAHWFGSAVCDQLSAHSYDFGGHLAPVCMLQWAVSRRAPNPEFSHLATSARDWIAAPVDAHRARPLLFRVGWRRGQFVSFGDSGYAAPLSAGEPSAADHGDADGHHGGEPCFCDVQHVCLVRSQPWIDFHDTLRILRVALFELRKVWETLRVYQAANPRCW